MSSNKDETLKVVLLSCYELGHQPLSVASPLAALLATGYQVTGSDLSVEPFPEAAVARADLVGISVPMHTAMRLGVVAARKVRNLNAEAVICFYGLYAWLNRDYLLVVEDGQRIADAVIAGEYEAPLLSLAAALHHGLPLAQVPGVSLPERLAPPVVERIDVPVPDRRRLPALSHYARFAENGHVSLAGYAETTRGCLHTCLHCPVVPVYQGRFFAVPLAKVMADIDAQVAAGAKHISFGDPDFLNGPGHALRVARAVHDRYPSLTYDFTTKVEHIISKADVVGQLRELGAAFVVSAFESTSDRVLSHLRKGHTLADMDAALGILDAIGLPVQPTWVPFTPWSSLEDYLKMLDWIASRGLVGHVAAVQYSIRLLVPPDSALLRADDTANWLGKLDAANFGYRWAHPDGRMDELQRLVAAVAEAAGEDLVAAFSEIEALAYVAAGAPAPVRQLSDVLRPPRLTEDWFC